MTSSMKYKKLQTALKAELSSGNFPVGSRFYTEREIMEKYQVSSITVARALNEMTAAGYFERKRKLGTFVLESPEMPGMAGSVMTRPLYLNRSICEDTGENRNGVSWFVVEEIRRGVINSYPGAVKILDMAEIMEAYQKDPALLTILFPQHVFDFEKKYARALPENSIRIVLPPVQGAMYNCVRPNYLTGVFEAVEHLILSGHKRIAFLGRRGLTNRLAAYRIALESYGIELDPELLFLDESALNTDDGARLMHRILSAADRPTAVFCATDKLAIGALQTALSAGVRVPDELSLAGFDNIPAGRDLTPALSTVNVPYYELGETAVKLLFEKLKSGNDVPTATLMTNFIQRSTTN